MSTLIDICLGHNVVCHVTGKQLKMLSHETVHRNQIKLVTTKKGVKQSEMFNYSVFSRFGNNSFYCYCTLYFHCYWSLAFTVIEH